MDKTVADMIYVSLISYTPDSERTIAAAASLSTSTIFAVDSINPLGQLTSNNVELLRVRLPGSGLRVHRGMAELLQKMKVELSKFLTRLALELKPKCYRLGYCGEAERCGIFTTAKETVKQKE